MRKLRSIQVLRAVAACGVVVLHCYGKAYGDQGWSRLGAAGVDLFFVISGFIMANVAPGRSPVQFLADRLWRIFPLWLVAVGLRLYARPAGPAETWSSLTLWPIYGGAFHFPALIVGWTLSFELLFYCAVTLALATRAVVPLAIFAASGAAWLLFGNAIFAFLGSPMILEFLFGVLVSRLPRSDHAGIMLIVLGVLCFLVAPLGVYSLGVVVRPELAILRAVFWGIPAAMILYGVVSIERGFAGKAFDVPVFLGDASYSIYLFHLFLLTELWPVSVVLCVVGGAAAFWFVERPLLIARKYRLARLRYSRPRCS